jgi:alpha-tubulin suppressor-like RCC1 family protein
VGAGSEWAAVFAGQYHTMAFKDDGSLWVWGYNSDGQLGIGNYDTYQLVPVQMSAAADWALVECGGYHTMGLKADGSLWAWGWNTYGQLGLGDTTRRNVPTKVGDGFRVP